jgi:hypothetical protein
MASPSLVAHQTYIPTTPPKVIETYFKKYKQVKARHEESKQHRSVEEEARLTALKARALADLSGDLEAQVNKSEKSLFNTTWYGGVYASIYPYGTILKGLIDGILVCMDGIAMAQLGNDCVNTLYKALIGLRVVEAVSGGVFQFIGDRYEKVSKVSDEHLEYLKSCTEKKERDDKEDARYELFLEKFDDLKHSFEKMKKKKAKKTKVSKTETKEKPSKAKSSERHKAKAKEGESIDKKPDLLESQSTIEEKNVVDLGKLCLKLYGVCSADYKRKDLSPTKWISMIIKMMRSDETFKALFNEAINQGNPSPRQGEQGYGEGSEAAEPLNQTDSCNEIFDFLSKNGCTEFKFIMLNDGRCLGNDGYVYANKSEAQRSIPEKPEVVI